ncbi:MAG: hypothetical protein EOO41_03950, partial [Methanobacteriota archaeon]
MPHFGPAGMAAPLPAMWPVPVEATYMTTPRDMRAMAAYGGAPYPMTGVPLQMMAAAPGVAAASATADGAASTRALARACTPPAGAAAQARYAARDATPPMSFDSLSSTMTSLEQQQQQQACLQYMYALQQHMQERAACADASGPTGMLAAAAPTTMYAPVHMSAAPYQA